MGGKRVVAPNRIFKLYEVEGNKNGGAFVDKERVNLVVEFYEFQFYDFSHYKIETFPYHIMTHESAKQFSDLHKDYLTFCDGKGQQSKSFKKVTFVKHSKNLYADKIRFEYPDIDHCDNFRYYM